MWKKVALAVLVGLLLLGGFVYVRYAEHHSLVMDQLEGGSQIAETERGPIEYELKGEDGPVLLFLHGTPGGYDQGAREAGYRVLSPSRPGYLRTPLTVGRTPKEQAHAYAALLDTLGVDHVYVMGASGGGPSAIEFAALFPERTNALVLVEAVSASMPEDDDEMPGFMRTDFTAWFALSAFEWISGPEGIVEMLIPDPENRARVLQDETALATITNLIWGLWPPSRRMVGMDNDLLQMRDMRLPVDELTVPVLLIHGTADASVPYAQSVALADRLPNATLETIEGADHMMPFTHAEEMAQKIETFVQTIQ